MPEMPEHLPRQVQANRDHISALELALHDLAEVLLVAAEVPEERMLAIAEALRRFPPHDDADAKLVKDMHEIRCSWADRIERRILKQRSGD